MKFKDLPASDQEALEEITSLEVHQLNTEQKAYLRARADYLKPEQKEIFKEVLESKKK